MYRLVWQCKTPKNHLRLPMSLKLSLDPRVFKPPPPWSVREPKSSLWVMKKKGLASTSFGGLVLFWVTIEKSNYNPAIVSGQTGLAGHFVLSSDWLIIGRGAAQHPPPQDRCLSFFAKLLSSRDVQEQGSGSLSY